MASCGKPVTTREPGARRQKPHPFVAVRCASEGTYQAVLATSGMSNFIRNSIQDRICAFLLLESRRSVKGYEEPLVSNFPLLLPTNLRSRVMRLESRDDESHPSPLGRQLRGHSEPVEHYARDCPPTRKLNAINATGQNASSMAEWSEGSLLPKVVRFKMPDEPIEHVGVASKHEDADLRLPSRSSPFRENVGEGRRETRHDRAIGSVRFVTSLTVIPTGRSTRLAAPTPSTIPTPPAGGDLADVRGGHSTPSQS